MQIWQKCFSERTKRHFYYNTLTKKSVWELPSNYSPPKRRAIDPSQTCLQQRPDQQISNQHPTQRLDRHRTQQHVAATSARANYHGAGPHPTEHHTATTRMQTKPWVIFDVNGTLASTTAKRRQRGAIKIRPGLEHIQRLHPFYRIALWSSMSQRNMDIAVDTLTTKGRIGTVDRVLDRRACAQAPQNIHTKAWDTIKPLWPHFGRFEPDGLARVVIVEDVTAKVVPEERRNLLHVPCWNEEQKDEIIPALIQELIGMQNANDLRHHTAAASMRLFQLYDNDKCVKVGRAKKKMRHRHKKDIVDGARMEGTHDS